LQTRNQNDTTLTNKEKYRRLCNEKPIPLFMQAWWLDAVTMPEGKQWEVLLAEENGKIVAAMPYHLLRKWGFKIIIQPQLTQYTGVWIDYPQDCTLHKRYSFEKRAMDNLIDRLEALNPLFYAQNFYYSLTNWQPFYWRGFEQTTRYSYILKNISDSNAVFENMHPRYRQKIRKCEQELELDFNLSPEEFYRFHKQSLQEKHDGIVYSKQLFLSIFQAAAEQGKGQIIAVRNKNNELLSAVFFVWDENSGYNLITVRKIINGSNDASVFTIWQVVEYLKNRTKNYDFEGSMIEGVALRNQYLGAEQMPYFHISKSYSKLFSLYKLFNRA
jgi:hypothetical protein